MLNLTAFAGCKHLASRATWTCGEKRYNQELCSPEVCQRRYAHLRQPNALSALQLANRAAALDAQCDSSCVDYYYASACRAWQDVAALGEHPGTEELVETSTTYHTCLAKLIATAQRHHRLDPSRGLTVFDITAQPNDQPQTIPVEHLGFAWTTEDFNALELVGEYDIAKRAKPIRTRGIGVPVVVKRLRCEAEPFYLREHPFAATVVLRPRHKLGVSATNDNPSTAAVTCDFVLQFYNPVACTKLSGIEGRWPLAGDLTAPLALQLSETKSQAITEFLRPDRDQNDAQLVMLEPYQFGKIPVVFVHGLLSEPTTWIEMGNQLRSQSWFRDRYQVWVFRYPTGMPFLVSAATLRRQLNAALASARESADDPAARHVVLIGHSMGALVAKLQVTESGTAIWDEAAYRPLDQIVASNEDRQRLQEVFFFEPQPFIRRVIFIGAPHRGATMAMRGAGRVGSCLARPTSEADARHRRVVADNPGAFKPLLSNRVPTSLDLLEPDNPLLLAMEHLPVSPKVQLHSIVGVSKFKSPGSTGDGIVSLASASVPDVASERMVSERHQDLHRAAATVVEVERILEDELRELDSDLAAQ